MNCAILRGFDFSVRDAGDQLRFCNPMLSFEEGAAAPIHFARDLEWRYGDDDQSRGLTPVDVDEVESFGTLVSAATLDISPGEGVVLMGERFVEAARNAGIKVDRGRSVSFTPLPESRCWFAVASVDAFRTFSRQLTGEAALAFDEELPTMSDGVLSERGEAALFLLRKIGLTRPTDLALRQLSAAFVTRQMDTYRRLLIRFSIELDETEDNLSKRVERHVRVAQFASATKGTELRGPPCARGRIYGDAPPTV